jgi:hypothetical protein
MGTIHKTVTPAVLAANQANSAASTGPVTDSGREQSKMNAFKNGKYARRPNPIELLLKDHSEEEEAEREELRAEMIRCYGPPDDFARLQAEELADFQFELRRLERAQEAVLTRERELLQLEQRKRALRLKQDTVEAPSKEVNDCGLVSQPDSPGKLREMLRVLEALVEQDWEIGNARLLVQRLYGEAARNWRGVRVRRALNRAEKAESDEERECANRDFQTEVKREIEWVREELAICELEQGPLSPAGEAARLLEAMNSRKWSSMRQREMFLRRSIDRKVQVLIELRREANRSEYRAAAQPAGQHTAGDQGDSTSGVNHGGGDGGASSGGSSLGAPAGAGEPGTEASAPNPESPAPSPEAGNGGIDRPFRGRNQGTKPLSPLFTAEFCAQTWIQCLDHSGDSTARMEFEPPDKPYKTAWSRASRS